MSKRYTHARHTAARLELLAALIECHGERLLEATAAGCAIVAHADGEAVPAEAQRLLDVARTDPLLSMFVREAVLAEFASHARAFALDPERARADALRRVAPLAARPRLARAVLDACLAVTRADGLVHPREVEAVRLVRDALGLAPDPGGAPARPGRRGDARYEDVPVYAAA